MTISEPKEAFPYKPPTEEVKKNYANLFNLREPLHQRYSKLIFDKIISIILIFLTLPLLIFLKFAYIVEGLLIPENKGPMLFYYWAVSGGKKIKKWKLRVIKTSFIDSELASKNEWLAFSAEWNDQSRTYVGSFVKKWYLDEIPQFWSVFIGDISIVGPRTLSEIHYKRDREQGNVARSLIKGGMLGLGHINKGTSEMGNSTYEYEYIDEYINRSEMGIIKLDLWIIWKGVRLMLKGGGH